MTFVHGISSEIAFYVPAINFLGINDNIIGLVTSRQARARQAGACNMTSTPSGCKTQASIPSSFNKAAWQQVVLMPLENSSFENALKK